MNFKQLLKNIFADAEEKNQHIKPFVQEMLVRSDKELKTYEQWQSSKNFTEIKKVFQQRLKTKYQLSNAESFQVEFIEGQATSGFVCYYNSYFFRPDTFQHVFDFLKQQVLTHFDYKLYVSDTQTRLQQNNAYTKERHYLKPKYVYDEVNHKVIQQYGNVIIELHKVNNEPEKIHFIVNRYSGFDYSEAISVELLYRKIFE